MAVGPPLAPTRAHTDAIRDAPTSSDDDNVSRHAVLIFAADPLAAALLGAAAELVGHEPHFPRQGEVPRAALLRVRPRLALIDCEHQDACSESFVGPALMTEARVLLFRSARTHRDASDFATRLGLTVLSLPADTETYLRLLREQPDDST
jgi:hypothetical protein